MADKPTRQMPPLTAAVPSTDFLDPEFHLEVVDDLVYSAECAGSVPLASYPDNRYPYVYPATSLR